MYMSVNKSSLGLIFLEWVKEYHRKELESMNMDNSYEDASDPRVTRVRLIGDVRDAVAYKVLLFWECPDSGAEVQEFTKLQLT